MMRQYQPFSFSYLLLVGLLSFLPLSACASSVTQLWSAEFLLSDAETPPPDNSAWEKVSLPDKWTDPERYRQGLTGWYRLQLPANAPIDESWSIYLWRLDMNAAVYFNGAFLGDGGRFEEPTARNWNRPLYFQIPDTLWRPDVNIIYIRLKAYPWYGVLAPVFIGPDSALRPQFELRGFLQNTMSESLFTVTMAVALFMLGLWLRRRHDYLYLLFALSLLAYSTFSLNLFVRDIPVSAKTWWTLTHACIDWWVVLLALFAHRFAGIARPRTDWLLLAFASLGSLLYALSPLEYLSRVTQIWHLGALLVGIYLVVFLTAVWRRQRSWELGLFAAGMTLVLALGVHDWLLNSVLLQKMWMNGFHLLHLGTPALFLVISWHLTERFIRALNEAETLNRDLEARVSAARQELALSYEAQEALRQQQVAIEERERIYQDLHDDMGAKLLSLVYRAENTVNADLARAALQDLRDVVSRPVREGAELMILLTDWQAENRSRLEAAGMELHWHEPACLPKGILPPELGINLERILREAVSNAIRHSGASAMWVKIDLTEEELRLQIEDDGPTADISTWHPGRGLRNMQERARLSGGELERESRAPNGCRVRVRVPLKLDESANTNA